MSLVCKKMQIGDKWTNWAHALLMQHLNYNKCSYGSVAIEQAHTEFFVLVCVFKCIQGGIKFPQDNVSLCDMETVT